MNPVEKAIRKLDATQRRYTPTAFVFGVVKKYGDDNGGALASNLAYSAFVSIFPLLLILSSGWGLCPGPFSRALREGGPLSTEREGTLTIATLMPIPDERYVT